MSSPALTPTGTDTANPMWQQLQSLRPMLASHASCKPRNYRGELFYVLHDINSARFHKLSPPAYELIGAMNGRRDLSEVLRVASIQLGQQGFNEIPGPQDVIELLQYLFVADLLICDIPPSTQSLFVRQGEKRKQRWRRLWANPLSWRIVLGNPNRVLDRCRGFARALTTWPVALLWVVLVVTAVLQALLHWPQLSAVSMDTLLSPGNLILLWLTYPLLKIIHELGHALYTKAFGGDVYECGIVFILGVPLPYVDATAATGFDAKSQRLMVSAAGMAVELLLAAVALLLWLVVENTLAKAILFNVALLGSVSTLLFNGNPLLKFDGYHLLCDLLETPNLASRAKLQWRYFVERFGYGVSDDRGEARSAAESVGLIGYALAAYAYRFLILAVIFFILAQVSLWLAVVLLGWVLGFQLFWPLLKYIHYLWRGEALKSHRGRAMAVVCVTVITVFGLLFVVPLPLSTQAEGVVWLPQESQIRAGTDGVIATIDVNEDQTVGAGTPIMQLHNPALVNRYHLKQAELKEYQLRYEQFFASNRVRANVLREDLAVLAEEVTDLERQVARLNVTSPMTGRVYLAGAEQLPGRFLSQGDIAAYVVAPEVVKVRVALTQEEVGGVRQATSHVSVRLAGDLKRQYQGSVVRQVPGGTYRLPSPVLGTQGGGRLATKTSENGQQQSVQQIFLLDVALTEEVPAPFYGQRAYVHFSHPPEPVARRWYRQLRQLFIRQLGQ
ncbi:HlyD family efflux transporter periplasmic adaptor subunit [Gilvimarinus agarilyticus]|uniref:HlyD family efflux transporter periplasmic adaptor subunit n=1 Tax=Gilvimarinus agarilyticus TaxID=679259 RepID=UPI001E53D72B|nr:HlyD family efflux transporter periplasmic adaptor subunit [Gilvimarinus agarilyticus]